VLHFEAGVIVGAGLTGDEARRIAINVAPPPEQVQKYENGANRVSFTRCGSRAPSTAASPT
jgi:hypothetical protein